MGLTFGGTAPVRAVVDGKALIVCAFGRIVPGQGTVKDGQVVDVVAVDLRARRAAWSVADGTVAGTVTGRTVLALRSENPDPGGQSPRIMKPVVINCATGARPRSGPGAGPSPWVGCTARTRIGEAPPGRTGWISSRIA